VFEFATSKKFESGRSCKKFETKKDNISGVITYKDLPNFKVYVSLY